MNDDRNVSGRLQSLISIRRILTAVAVVLAVAAVIVGIFWLRSTGFFTEKPVIDQDSISEEISSDEDELTIPETEEKTESGEEKGTESGEKEETGSDENQENESGEHGEDSDVEGGEGSVTEHGTETDENEGTGSDTETGAAAPTVESETPANASEGTVPEQSGSEETETVSGTGTMAVEGGSQEATEIGSTESSSDGESVDSSIAMTEGDDNASTDGMGESADRSADGVPDISEVVTALPSGNEIGENEVVEDDTDKGSTLALMVCLVVLCTLLCVDLGAVVLLSVKIMKLKSLIDKKPSGDDVNSEGDAITGKMVTEVISVSGGGYQPPSRVDEVSVGKVHNIGSRASQQDSFGIGKAGSGMLAVVADGMGGLSGGDQVSQRIVMLMLEYAANLRVGQMDGVLASMVERVNQDVNRMLGTAGLYKSGSTMVSVLIQNGRFHWISVGDSRIYLYRAGSLIQLNQEHTYEQELIQRAINEEIRFEEVWTDPQRQRLTSFIGMGKLKHVDASLRSIELRAGDRLLLMSDGVFNTLSEERMSEILASLKDPEQAAARFDAEIQAIHAPKQDNYTAVILAV